MRDSRTGVRSVGLGDPIRSGIESVIASIEVGESCRRRIQVSDRTSPTLLRRLF